VVDLNVKLYIIILLLSISAVYAEWRYNPFTDELDYYTTISTDAYNSSYEYWDNSTLWSTFNATYESGASYNSSYEYWGNATLTSTYNITYDSYDSTYNASYLESSYNPFDQSLNTTDNVVFKNITADYYSGQPLDGSIGCGIIYSSSNKLTCGCINVTDDGGLTVGYPDLIVRVVNTSNDYIYCNVSSSTVSVPDNAHTVYYLDGDCAMQHLSFENYFSQAINPGEYCRIFDVKTHNSDIEHVKGSSLMSLSAKKESRINVQTSHLQTTDGMALDVETFPYFNFTSGHYIYINTIVTSLKVSSQENGTHLIGHTGGTITHFDDTGLNLTHCDDGTDTAECPDNKYRRYLIGVEGWGEKTHIHQFAPSTSDDTFTTLANCINIAKYPLEFNNLATEEEWAFVKIVAYCGKRDDSAWRDGWIAIDGGGTISGSIDTSSFLTRDGLTPLTANWDLGGYNITGYNWFVANESNDNYNSSYEYWTNSTLWASYNSSYEYWGNATLWMTYNSSYEYWDNVTLTATYNATYDGYDSTYNSTYDGHEDTANSTAEIQAVAVGGETSGTVGSITLSNTALDDQYIQLDNSTVNTVLTNDPSDWDVIGDVPTATPSDGDTTHLSLADQIYDWVVSLGYITNTYNSSYEWFTNTTIFQVYNSSYEYWTNSTLWSTYNVTYEPTYNSSYESTYNVTYESGDSYNSSYLNKDGTVALTANWDVGNYNITAKGFNLEDNEVDCYGDDCDSCEYWNGTHKIEESPCTV